MSLARATEWAALWRARAGSAGRPGRGRGCGVGDARGAASSCRSTGTIVIGAAGDGERLETGVRLGAGGEAFDLAVDPLEGRGVVARGGNGAMSMIAVGRARIAAPTLPDMYMRRRWRSGRARAGPDRPHAAGRRERRRDRRGLRPPPGRHHDDRPRAAPAPRPDRGDPRRGRPDQADPGRRRDGVDLRGDPRHERPPGDRDRRHAAGGAGGRRAALPRRRAPGSALADHTRRDRSRRPSTGSRTSTASSPPRTSRRAR